MSGAPPESGDRPIPRLRGGHGWREVPIDEGGEPLVDLDGVRPTLVATAGGAGPIRVRRGVAERLAAAASTVERADRTLVVVEGHRSHRRQAELFRERLYRLAAMHPDWPPDALEDVAAEIVAPPSPSRVAPAPHRTGAAVNLALGDARGRPLTTIGAPGHSDTAGIAEDDPSGEADRRLLFWALAGAGLVVDGERPWHWSHGDQRWAVVSGAAVAIHGPVDAPDAPAADRGPL